MGIIVNDYLTKHFDQLINYEFTKLMESDLDKISLGENSWFNVVELIYNKIKISINNCPQTPVKDTYMNELGINPHNNRKLCVYIGQYGPVLKEINDNPGCKDRFISLKDDLLDNITLDEAIKMLQYPRIIGTHNNIDILLDKGRYGLYIKYNDKNFSYKITDEENININELVDFIEFASTSNNGLIKKLNDKMKIMNGKYGPYIQSNQKNYKIIIDKSFNEEEKNKYLSKLTIKDCNEIISNSKTNKYKNTKNTKK